MSDIYVVVCERDTYREDDGGRPIVFEQYIDGDCASLESAEKHRARLGNKYGKCRIARLEFIEGEA
jgi:hypothetical protein